MKKYHCFTKLYSNRFIAVGEYCIYCKINANDLYYLKDNSKLYPAKSMNEYAQNKNLNTIELENDFYATYFPCKNGITEEEYIIKKIIE
jgi:hypothetical protein